MVRRALAISAIFVLLGVSFGGVPASSQDSPLQGVIDPLAEGLKDVKEGLAPVEDGLNQAIGPILDGIEPLLTQLEAILAQGAAACDLLGPVLDGLKPLTTELQTLLDVDVSGLPIVGTLQPVVATVNGLIDQALNLCAAATTTTAAAVQPTAPAQTLPATGGRPGLAAVGALVLGASGLLVAARRRLSAAG